MRLPKCRHSVRGVQGLVDLASEQEKAEAPWAAQVGQEGSPKLPSEPCDHAYEKYLCRLIK